MLVKKSVATPESLPRSESIYPILSAFLHPNTTQLATHTLDNFRPKTLDAHPLDINTHKLMPPAPCHRCKPQNPTLESFPCIFPFLSVECLLEFLEFLEEAFDGWALRDGVSAARKEGVGDVRGSCRLDLLPLSSH